MRRKKMSNDYIRKQDAVDAVNHALDRETILFSFVRKVAISALKKIAPADVVQVEELKAEIYKLKHQSEQSFGNHYYYVGYISALSTVEGILAVMDREE
jgi:hypothetical protein